VTSAAKGVGSIVSAAVFDAHGEAERILADARAEATDLRERARAEGLATGRAEADAELGARMAALAVEAARARAAAADDLKRLAVHIAEKILGHALAVDQGLCADVCAQALATAAEQRRITLRVHPDDLAIVEAARPRFRGLLARADDFELRADAALSRGGCIIETELGRVDARLETQLLRFERALLPSS
jgi:type III secretion system HrpE/YscL family protein